MSPEYEKCPWFAFLSFENIEKYQKLENSMNMITSQLKNIDFTSRFDLNSGSKNDFDQNGSVPMTAPQFAVTASTIDVVQLITDRAGFMASTQHLQHQLAKVEKESAEKLQRIRALEREVEQLRAHATQYRGGFGGGKVFGRDPQSVDSSLTLYCGGRGAPTSKRPGDSSGSHGGSSVTKVRKASELIGTKFDGSSTRHQVPVVEGVRLKDPKLLAQFKSHDGQRDGLEQPNYQRSRDAFLAAVQANPNESSTKILGEWKNTLARRFVVWVGTLNQEVSDVCLLHALQFLLLKTQHMPEPYYSDMKLGHAYHIALQMRDAMKSVLANDPNYDFRQKIEAKPAPNPKTETDQSGPSTQFVEPIAAPTGVKKSNKRSSKSRNSSSARSTSISSSSIGDLTKM